MEVIDGTCAHKLYRRALTKVWREGIDVPVRGFQTREILNAATVIREPWHHCLAVPGRRWNPWIAMSEALWILAGRMDVYALEPYNSRIKQFSDDGHRLYGAYGWRIKLQIEPMLKRLETDPHDRRAILQIWNKDDLWAETKDPPCNDMVMFKLRRERLHMTVINRSNDLHWGLYAVNIPTFGILQDYIAARLGVEMGTQTHFSNSLHIYTGGKGMKENWRITERMIAAMPEKLPEMPWHERCFTEPIPFDTLRRACSLVLNNKTDKPVYHGTPFLEFAEDFLGAYRMWQGSSSDESIADGCRHADKYQDWVLAARVWMQEGYNRWAEMTSRKAPAASMSSFTLSTSDTKSTLTEPMESPGLGQPTTS